MMNTASIDVLGDILIVIGIDFVSYRKALAR